MKPKSSSTGGGVGFLVGSPHTSTHHCHWVTDPDKVRPGPIWRKIHLHLMVFLWHPTSFTLSFFLIIKCNELENDFMFGLTCKYEWRCDIMSKGAPTVAVR